MTLETITKLAQASYAGNPTIVLGSGASMPHGLPSMGNLATYLQDNLKPNDQAEAESWTLVQQSLSDGNHLEAALEGKNIPPTLLKAIVNRTWECVNEKDCELFRLMASGGEVFPLGRLFLALFNSTNTTVNVVTTNYDRVAEFSCNSARLLFQTGFTPGYLQKWEANGGVNFQRNGKAARVVKIWKVHGSLDWFETVDGGTIGLPVFLLPTGDILPLIVTPGLNKYEKTHQDPFRSTISGADSALGNAAAFLCIGFGFRDQHIQPKIVERCRERNVPIVVLAKTLTDEAKSFLRDKAGSNYLGIEEAVGGSTVYTSDCPDGEVVDVEGLWSTDGFINLVT